MLIFTVLVLTDKNTLIIMNRVGFVIKWVYRVMLGYISTIDIVGIMKGNSLNSREISYCIWILIFIIFSFLKRDIRKSLLKAVRCIFNKKLMTPVILFIIYNFILVYFLFKLHLWNTYLLKDTFVWLIFSGILTLFKGINGSKTKGYFRKIGVDNFKLSIVLQFILNEYPMNLLTEICLVPITIFIVGLLAIVENNKEYDQNIKKFFAFVQGTLIATIIYSSLKLAILDINNLSSFKELTKFIVPVILSILSIIPAYLLALYSTYESIFLRLDFYKGRRRDVTLYVKFKLLLHGNININKINDIWRNKSTDLTYLDEESDVKDLF